jgi:tripartite-type tricarboxylate transporter receptor subunit TctC
MITLKKLISLVLAFAAGSSILGDAAATAAPYPSKPIKLIVPFAAGGSGDVVGRIFGERVGAELGQPVIVENRAGGNSVVGTQVAVRSKPDGYTILQVTPGNVIIPILQDNIAYNWERDLTPVIGVGSVPLVLAVPAKSNVRSIADLVAAANSIPDGLIYASGGAGSMSHLAAARLVRALKIKATHIPYRGLSGSLQALLGDQTHFIFTTFGDVTELAKSGSVRLLAVTSEQRLPYLPDVPTMAELGIENFYPAVWYGYVMPVGTPKDIIERVYRAFAKATNDPDVQERLGKLGFTTKITTDVEFGKYMHDEAARWREVIEEDQIKMEN